MFLLRTFLVAPLQALNFFHSDKNKQKRLTSHFSGKGEDAVDRLVEGRSEPVADQLAVAGDDLNWLVDGTFHLELKAQQGYSFMCYLVMSAKYIVCESNFRLEADFFS